MIIFYIPTKKGEAKALAEKFKGKSFYSKVCHFRYEEGFNSAIGCIKNTHYHIRQGGGDALLWTCTKILTKLQWTEGIQPPSPPHIGMLPLGLMLIYKQKFLSIFNQNLFMMQRISPHTIHLSSHALFCPDHLIFKF